MIHFDQAKKNTHNDDEREKKEDRQPNFNRNTKRMEKMDPGKKIESTQWNRLREFYGCCC